MRKVAVVVVLLLLLLAGGWLILGGQAPRTSDDARGAGPRAPVAAIEEGAPLSTGPSAETRSASETTERARSKQQRDALRRRILAAMPASDAAERDGAAREDEGEGEGPRGGRTNAPTPPHAGPKPPDDETPTPGNLIDRTGNHGHMVKVMNEELMPLVDECYALARETRPELTGLLVLDVELLGDEDLGGVVESVMLGQGNELADPALVECVQESLLSTTLPPPPEGGKEAIQLQLRLEPE